MPQILLEALMKACLALFLIIYAETEVCMAGDLTKNDKRFSFPPATYTILIKTKETFIIHKFFS